MLWCAGCGLVLAGIPYWSTAAALLYPLVLAGAAADGSPPPAPLPPPRARHRRPACRRDARQPPLPDRDGSALPPRGWRMGSSGPPRGHARAPPDTGNRGLASEAGGAHALRAVGDRGAAASSPTQRTCPPHTHFLRFCDGVSRTGAGGRPLLMDATAGVDGPGRRYGRGGGNFRCGRAGGVRSAHTRLITDGRSGGVWRGGEIHP